MVRVARDPAALGDWTAGVAEGSLGRTRLQGIVGRGPPMEIRKTWGVHESLGCGGWRGSAPTGAWLFVVLALRKAQRMGWLRERLGKRPTEKSSWWDGLGSNSGTFIFSENPIEAPYEIQA